MSDLKAKFEQAAKDVHSLAERPDNDTLLRLYGLYKQGAEGDVNGPKPGFDFRCGSPSMSRPRAATWAWCSPATRRPPTSSAWA